MRRATSLLTSSLVATAVLAAPPAAAEPGAFDLQSHRGGRGETTEESLRAFAKSLELGVSTLELDIVLTRDNQPLVWHDPASRPPSAPTPNPPHRATRSSPTSASWCTT